MERYYVDWDREPIPVIHRLEPDHDNYDRAYSSFAQAKQAAVSGMQVRIEVLRLAITAVEQSKARDYR